MDTADDEQQHLNSARNTLIHTVESLLNLVNHIFIGFITIYMTWDFYQHDMTTSTVHAWLCTIGFQCFAAKGIIMLYPANSWLLLVPVNVKKTMHWMFQLIGIVMGITGVAFMVDHVQGKHFATVHGALGLAGTVIMTVNLLGGVFIHVSIKLRSFVRPIILRTVHNFLGISGLVLCLMSLFYGYSYLARNTDASFVEMMQVFTIITLLLSLIGAFKSLGRQLELK